MQFTPLQLAALTADTVPFVTVKSPVVSPDTLSLNVSVNVVELEFVGVVGVVIATVGTVESYAKVTVLDAAVFAFPAESENLFAGINTVTVFPFV